MWSWGSRARRKGEEGVEMPGWRVDLDYRCLLDGPLDILLPLAVRSEEVLQLTFGWFIIFLW